MKRVIFIVHIVGMNLHGDVIADNIMMRMMIMIALDTEDDSDGNVYIINFYDGIRHATFVGDDCRLAAWNWLLQQAPEKVWACNAEYDLINLFGPWLGKMCTLQYVRSGLLRASLRDAPVVFFDTLRHWPMSVENMGSYLGLPKLSADYRSVEYCRRDTEIVWRFVSEMCARYDELRLNLKATLPSMALQLWAKHTRIDPRKIPPSLASYFREGYYGGRVEVYRFGPIRGTTHHYDVNSLFPFVMRDKLYPDLSSWRSVQTPDFQREGMATVTLYLPESQYPCLPVRTADGIMYPYGLLTGTWTYPELRQAISDGGKLYDVARCVEFRHGGYRPFASYIDVCWGYRRAATLDLDKVFWKLMMNSLYGKFGQGDGLEMIYQDRDVKLDTGASHANVIWSAYVTAYARLTLLEWLRKTGEVYYTDTDSLFTPEDLPVSGELGSLKREGTYSLCEFVGKKIYTVDGTARAKGVPRSNQADFIRTGKAVYMKPARFRESRRSFAVANRWYEVEKHLLSEAHKRIILPDGSTRAWNYQDYGQAYPEQAVGVPGLRRGHHKLVARVTQ